MKDYGEEIRRQRDAAERRAWGSLAGYKFWMFGYWSSAWVRLNALLEPDDRKRNPWRELVQTARRWRRVEGGQTELEG